METCLSISLNFWIIDKDPLQKPKCQCRPILAAEHIVHVMTDAAVSVLVIIGLILAKLFGWLWMEPLAGIVGAFVIASWAASLIKVTGEFFLI